MRRWANGFGRVRAGGGFDPRPGRDRAGEAEPDDVRPRSNEARCIPSMPIRDYYDVLEVSREATQDEIKRAYRKLAKKYHPDANQGDSKADAEKRFKEVQQAYDVLGEEDKRKLYDKLGHSVYTATGGQVPPGAAGGGWPGGGPGGGSGRYEDFGPGGVHIDFGDFLGGGGGGSGGGGSIFEELFKRVRQSGAASGPSAASHGGRGGRGARSRARDSNGVPDLETHLKLPFATAVRGGSHAFEIRRDGVTMPMNYTFPPGTKTGDRLRLRGRGAIGPDGSRGDLVLVIEVEEHPHLKRVPDSRDLAVDVPITPGEAVFGGKVDVPTLDGWKTITLPPGSAAAGAKKLRLKGQGVPAFRDKPAGDLLATPRVVMPGESDLDEASRELIRKFDEANKFDPRASMRRGV